MVVIIRNTGFFITEKQAKKLAQLYNIASRTPVLTSAQIGIDSSKRERAWRKFFNYMADISEEFDLSIKWQGGDLKVGKDFELVYAVVN